MIADKWDEAVGLAHRQFMADHSRGVFLFYPCSGDCPGLVGRGCRFSKCVYRYPGDVELELLV